MVRATGARARATLVSTCLATAMSLGLAAPSLAADASPGVEGSPPAAPTDVPAADEPTARPESTEVPDVGAPGAEAWTPADLPGGQDIASGADRFVVVGGSGFPPQASAWASADGLTWDVATVSDPPAGTTLSEVVATDAGFVALGTVAERDGGEAERVVAWHSSDGLAWEPAPVRKSAKPGLQAVVESVASGPAGQLALGSFIGEDLAGQRLWRSTDGRAWQPARLPKATNAIWARVATVPDGYLLMGQQGAGKASNWRSVDGLTWEKLPKTPRLFGAAAGSDGTVVGIGWRDLWRTTDLSTWEKVWTRPDAWALDGENAFHWVDWDGSAFAVAGWDAGDCTPQTDECHDQPLLVSADGTAWTEAAGPDGQPGTDDGVWLQGIAALGESTVLLGEQLGEDVAWLVEGDLVP